MQPHVQAPPAPPAPSGRPAGGPVPGQLTPGWRYATAAVWFLVFVALSGVWKASRELGLAMWWLGPPGEPRPIVVMLVPFYAPAAMVIAALTGARRLPWLGLLTSAVLVAVAVPDLDAVRRLAIVELAIAGAGSLASIAALSGRYRRPAQGQA